MTVHDITLYLSFTFLFKKTADAPGYPLAVSSNCLYSRSISWILLTSKLFQDGFAVRADFGVLFVQHFRLPVICMYLAIRIIQSTWLIVNFVPKRKTFMFCYIHTYANSELNSELYFI